MRGQYGFEKFHRWHALAKGRWLDMFFHGYIQLHTAFDTIGRFWVLIGITRQHEAQMHQRSLSDEIRRNHETARKRKIV